MPLVSIIIRTKNEERWISSCIKSINSQSYKNFEIIIVDNLSRDKTVSKAKKLGVKKIVKIKKYLPGKSLNLGIENSKGDYIVCLSAHCIPKSKSWLKSLVSALQDNPNVAGAYGRQQPMKFSSDADKRDLFLVFGLDKRIQVKDSFFHNANSILRKSLWKKNKFDEKITNIEDRIWAKKIISKGWKILYEPEASVYHYHGIHQDGNPERLKNVVNIIQKQDINFTEGSIDPKRLNIIAIIPVKGKTNFIKKKPLLALTIKSAKQSKYIKEIFVSTDNKETKKIAINHDVKCPFLRPKRLSSPKISLENVQKYSLEMIEKNYKYPDLIVHLEETFPFRDKDMIDKMIEILLNSGYDSLLAAKEESGWIWKESSAGSFDRIDEGDIPRKFKKKSLVGLHGLCCITYPEYIRQGKLLGPKTGLYKAGSQLSAIEIREKSSFNLFNTSPKEFIK